MFTARGTEDPATGAASCALVGLLASGMLVLVPVLVPVLALVLAGAGAGAGAAGADLYWRQWELSRRCRRRRRSAARTTRCGRMLYKNFYYSTRAFLK